MNHPKKSHLGLNTHRLPNTVLIAGDPNRLSEMASIWDTADEIANSRAYVTIAGSYRGTEIAACSTGIGGASTEIGIVELAQHGAKNIIRVGTCGGIDPSVEPGDLVIMTACVRYSGTADSYAPVNYPAVGDHNLTHALIGACCNQHFPVHIGLGISTDAYYATKPDYIGGDFSFRTELAGLVDRWAESGALAMEQEAAALMVVGSLLGLRTAVICTVGSNVSRGTASAEMPSNSRAIVAACEAAVLIEERMKDGNELR